MADQAASLYGSGCFGEGELKVTMGTGTFINVNTASEPHASVAGLSQFLFPPLRDIHAYNMIDEETSNKYNYNTSL